MTAPRLSAGLLLAVLLFLACAAYLTSALGLSFGTWRAPRAGFLPIIVGIIGTVLAATNLLGTLLAAGPEQRLGPAPWRAALFALALALYVPALTLLGYIPSTAITLFALLKIHEAAGWLRPLLVAALTGVGTWALFSQLLELRLP